MQKYFCIVLPEEALFLCLTSVSFALHGEKSLNCIKSRRETGLNRIRLISVTLDHLNDWNEIYESFILQVKSTSLEHIYNL